MMDGTEEMKKLEELELSPLPWFLKEGTDVPCYRLYGVDGLAGVPIVSEDGTIENSPDAFMFVAAPSLYESLYEAVCCYCRGRVCCDKHRNACLDKDDEALSSCPAKRWRKALAKAMVV